MANNFYKAKAWNAICDSCGFKFKSTDLKLRWDGLMVDDACWEPRQPQDFLRSVQENSNHLPWTRPETDVLTFLPVADFSGDPTYAVAPSLVQFTDLTTHSPTSWSWDFGDGNTSVLQNPSNTFTAVGIYNVTLTATNATGSSTITKLMYIVADVEPPLPPAVPQTWDPINVGTGVILSNGNLTADVPTFYKAAVSTGTHDISSGQRYFEILVGYQNEAFGFLGISTSTNDVNDLLGGAGTPSHAYQTRMISGSVGGWGATDPAPPNSVSAGAWAEGDVVGFAVDFATQTITVYINGVLTPGIAYFEDLETNYGPYDYFIAVSHSNVGSHIFTIRTADSEFSYMPPPGYISWGTP